MYYTLAHPWDAVELWWAHACTRACACMRVYLFSFLSVKTPSYLCFTNVYDRICFLFVHNHEHARQLSAHTRARTCRDHSHTLELRWWRVWRWFALPSHTIIKYKHAYLCVCVYMYIYIYIYICFLFVCFSIIPDSWLPNSLVPRYRSLYLFNNQLSALPSGVFAGLSGLWWVCACVVDVYGVRAWVKVLNVCVCTYEGIWQLCDLTSNACCTWIGPQDCIYKHQDTRTYSRDRQRDTVDGLAK